MTNKLKSIYCTMLALFLVITSASFSPLHATTKAVVITEGGYWFESAYVTWQAYQGATDYHVYYKQTNEKTFTLADQALIRGTQIDLPGLKGDTAYTLKIVPIVKGEEVTLATASMTLTPMTHDRSGYAFFNGTTTGGYNEDGTAPSNANILYVTNENKNTITLNGYKGIAAILSESARKNDKTPLIVRFIGQIDVPSGATAYPDNMVKVKAASNITLEGIGTDANINGWGFAFQRSNNIEVRNLDFYWYPEDALGFEMDCSRVWVHNNTIRKGHQDNPKESDKADGDGGTDFKYTDYVTVSYNHYDGAKKTALCGLKENETYRLSFHHNYFDGTGSRTPRVRFFDIHVYNNYYNNVGTYGIGASVDSNIFSENNYFENTTRPMVISMQGNGGTIFSKEDGGTIKAYGNVLIGCTKYTPGTDYYEASSKNEVIKFQATKGGSAYNNFDTDPKRFYVGDYTLHTAKEAKELVLTYAGRMKSYITVTPEVPSVPSEPVLPEEPSTPDVPVIPEEPNTPDVPTIPEGPSTPDVPVIPENPSMTVSLGTYTFKSSTLSSKVGTYKNISYDVRSIESKYVKLRQANHITFTVAKSCTLKVKFEQEAITLSTSNGSLTYNGSASKALTLDKSSVAVELAPGTYILSGALPKDNTQVYSLTLS